MTRLAAILTLALAVTACGDRGPSDAELCARAGGTWVITDFYQPAPVIVGSVAVNMPPIIEHTCLVGGQAIEVRR